MNFAKRKLAYILATLIILSASATAATSAQAADYTKIAVKVGDTADYTLSITNASIYESTGFHFIIANITGTVVEFNATYYLANGTTIPYMRTDDISLGGPGELAFVANLTVGDPIGTDPYYSSWRINETISMTVAGSNRTLNRLQVTQPGYRYMDLYWDKASGLVVIQKVKVLANGVYDHALGDWLNLTLTSTNVWSPLSGPPPNATTLLLIGGGIAIILAGTIAAVILRRRR